jgi:hypothetical protein
MHLETIIARKKLVLFFIPLNAGGGMKKCTDPDPG